MKRSKLRQIREDKDLTILQLSVNTMIHPSTLSMIERDKQAAGRRTRAKISKFYGVDENELFDNEGFAC
jgi:transcriptional regulator with XRE-family HTH domain